MGIFSGFNFVHNLSEFSQARAYVIYNNLDACMRYDSNVPYEWDPKIREYVRWIDGQIERARRCSMCGGPIQPQDEFIMTNDLSRPSMSRIGPTAIHRRHV